MDVGDSPALFWRNSEPFIAVGSKRGYFYVMNARDGTILNGSGRDAPGLPHRAGGALAAGPRS